MCRIQTAPGPPSKLLINKGLRIAVRDRRRPRGSRSCARSRVSRSRDRGRRRTGRADIGRSRGLRLDTSYEVEPPSSRKCTASRGLSRLLPRVDDVSMCVYGAGDRQVERLRAQDPFPLSFSPPLIPRLPTDDSLFLFVRPDHSRASSKCA